MTSTVRPPSREEVLDAFSVEPEPGGEVLERYLRDHPEYAAELVDLSRELARIVIDDEAPLSEADEALVERAWQRHRQAGPESPADPFALSATELRGVALNLGVPRQVITAFRERLVLPHSVPRRFVQRLAEALGSSVDALSLALSKPPTAGQARSYKADTQPTVGGQVTFEQVLVDAGVSEERRAALLGDAD